MTFTRKLSHVAILKILQKKAAIIFHYCNVIFG